MTERVMGLVGRIREHLVEKYGEALVEVLLYGSHARGDAGESSDIDLLVVVHEHVDPREVRRSLDDLLLNILLEEGEMISVIVIPKDLFDNYRSPFLLNVRREGIRV